MKRKILKKMILILMGIAVFFSFTACTTQNKDENQTNTMANNTGKKIKIVATLFPQYDFARQIAGDKAEVTLLLPPGTESHTYEPTPADIVKINQSDLFIYTGQYMEAWAKSILDGLEGNASVLDVSQNIQLEEADEEHEQTNQEGVHEHVLDPHIWTNPMMAKVMVENICNRLCELDPQNAGYYSENAQRYKDQLNQLDIELMSIVKNGKRNEIVFGGKFALHYFTQRYGLEYVAAYDSCSDETEPSAKAVSRIIDEIRQNDIPVIYYQELTDPKVAQSISDETGAKMLLLHSCHNVSKDDFNNGVTYLSLMQQNAQNLKEGLQ